jgi:hypothetical protein
MAPFDASGAYTQGIAVYNKASEEARMRTRVLRNLYDEAVSQLGYTEKQLRNNTDAHKQMSRLMFSDELAGNPNLNPLLSSSPFYKGYSSASNVEKQFMHQQGLGANYQSFVDTVTRFGTGLDDGSLNAILQQAVAEPYKRESVDTYAAIATEAPDLQTQKKQYAVLAGQDPLIDSVNPNALDAEELKRLVRESLFGDTRRSSLEDRVGVQTY